MSLISFAWTTPPLLAGAKTMTVRNWDHRYAAQFRAGDKVQAWDRGPRNHGQQIALIRLTQDAEYTTTDRLLDSDYEAEGLAWLAAHPEACPKTIFGHKFQPYFVSRDYFAARCQDAESIYVVRFELLLITQP